MNNHPKQIKLQPNDWAEKDWYNWNGPFAGRWPNFQVNDSAWRSNIENYQINGRADLLNSRCGMFHKRGTHENYLPKSRTIRQIRVGRLRISKYLRSLFSKKQYVR